MAGQNPPTSQISLLPFPPMAWVIVDGQTIIDRAKRNQILHTTAEKETKGEKKAKPAPCLKSSITQKTQICRKQFANKMPKNSKHPN